MGTKLNFIACSNKGVILFEKLQQVKYGMKSSKYQDDIGTTSSRMKHIMGATEGVVQFNNNKIYYFFFYSWFSYKGASDTAEDICAVFIGISKTSMKVFCKGIYWKVDEGMSHIIVPCFQ